jgi:FKBP-type peptidyl-prolyl cis-trans isomerase FkpA
MHRFLILSFLSVIFFSCGTDKEGYRKTESGLLYKFIDSSKGAKPELGDVLVMNIAYYTANDSLLYSSQSVSDSFPVVLVNPTFIGGVEEGFAMMSVGDSALFKVSADSLFEKTFFTTLPTYMQKGSSVYFRVRLKNIISKAVTDSIKSAKDISNRKLEFELIEKYLLENNMDVMPTQNGAYLSISKPGIGPNPQPGDSVYVAYTGKLLDGTVFDERTDRITRFGFQLGKQAVIEGWEECIPLLNKGAVAKMVIPSDLAYGADQIGALPPYSTLVFDVEILEIKPNPK